MSDDLTKEPQNNEEDVNLDDENLSEINDELEVQKEEIKENEEKIMNGQSPNLDFILDIPLKLTVELGRTKLLINDLLQLGQGSVIELDKLAGEPLEILVNDKLIARGEAVIVNEKFGVRITDILSPMDRVEKLSE